MQPDQNQYNFIMDPSQGGGSGPAFLQDPKKRNIIAVFFVLGVLFLAIIGFAVVSSLTSKSNPAIIDVVAYQNELVRISSLGLKSATEPTARVKASTLQSFMQSDLSQTSAYLASKGKKLEKTDLALHQDLTVDKDLETAALRNTYEEALLDAFDSTSAKYKASLQKALDNASSENEKAVLQTAAKNILTFEGTQENSGVTPSVEVTKL